LKIALDTNVLAYAEGINDAASRLKAKVVLDAIGSHQIVIPVQVLNELAHVLFKRARRPRSEIAISLTAWMDGHGTFDTTHSSFRDAIALSALHNLQIFDAVILAGAAQFGCGLLLSEDMQDGFTWRGCTVVNPFAAAPNPLLKSAYQAEPYVWTRVPPNPQ
jgi:predicted nucleic acid-binding protein